MLTIYLYIHKKSCTNNYIFRFTLHQCCYCDTITIIMWLFLNWSAKSQHFWKSKLFHQTIPLTLYAFVRWLLLHVFDHMVTTYGYFNIQSWDKNHSTQHEMAILIMYRYGKANYGKKALIGLIYFNVTLHSRTPIKWLQLANWWW